MDPDISPQFSTPELFQSLIISGSVWKQTLLSILSLVEHHSSDNQALPAPKILRVPPNTLMEVVLGCPTKSHPVELQGLCGEEVTAVTAAWLIYYHFLYGYHVVQFHPRPEITIKSISWTYLHIYFSTKKAQFSTQCFLLTGSQDYKQRETLARCSPCFYSCFMNLLHSDSIRNSFNTETI